MHDTLESTDDGVDSQLEEVRDGREEAPDYLQDRLHKVRDARCDAHSCGLRIRRGCGLFQLVSGSETPSRLLDDKPDDADVRGFFLFYENM